MYLLRFHRTVKHDSFDEEKYHVYITHFNFMLQRITILPSIRKCFKMLRPNIKLTLYITQNFDETYPCQTHVYCKFYKVYEAK